ncbi:AEC family transporter [Tropicimonas sp. IMCC6043]|uniref:AEC family transporter n=1 Tax=Tropicimonas sp. IMCC6043 TaxID=2510645 RepID=UPI00101B9199|nr:AEC family transporter [Tropicimonas sp. IMCC6043]RYH10952.1 AEC family transporter [Tropicimonas sp. IMCC6043]
MLPVLLKTLPFFGIIAAGFLAGRTRFFTDEATSYLTKFVFYFALSAMLFRFSANLSLAEVLSWTFIWAYLSATVCVYLLATAVARIRGLPWDASAVEAQCAVIGNAGFLGVPMLSLLMGPEAIGPVMMVLAVDLLVFSSLIVMVITGTRDGRIAPGVLLSVGRGLTRNPMIVSIAAGFIWSALELPIPVPMNEFLELLGAAATPCALFAIGASLASKSAERLSVAAWLSFAKLVLHPAAVAVSALLVFPVEAFAADVMIACAALPVAGNVYILARHYNVVPHRVSTSILVSTAASVITVSAVIAWVS